jgi:acyl carrier protein
MDTASIYPRVREIVADTLAIDESELKPDASLIDDYEAESIDFLDLVYRLEREFKVKIPRGQIEQDVRAALDGGTFEKRGRLTAVGMAKLREYLSEVPEERFRPGMPVNQIPTLFTTKTFCKLVVRARERAGQISIS